MVQYMGPLKPKFHYARLSAKLSRGEVSVKVADANHETKRKITEKFQAFKPS